MQERATAEIFRHITELRETGDIKEVARLLHTGEWIAICATGTEPYAFSLGRISREMPCPGNK